MRVLRWALFFACFPLSAFAQANRPLPDIHQLIREVEAHQKQLEKVRETYTFTSSQTTQDLDANGAVKKTETEEYEQFFVHGHLIARQVKKDGKPLSPGDDRKETERVTKLVAKAEKTPSDQPLEGQTIRISRLLEIMDVSAPRRETYRGRPAIVFDFVGRKDAKTHGMVEDASRKMKGTLWVDEADRQVAHLIVTFTDNFHVAGGLIANLQKGSTFQFEQAPVEEGLWLPTGGEGTVAVRVLLLKNMRQHFVERDYDYKRFKVDAQQSDRTTILRQSEP